MAGKRVVCSGAVRCGQWPVGVEHDQLAVGQRAMHVFAHARSGR